MAQSHYCCLSLWLTKTATYLLAFVPLPLIDEMESSEESMQDSGRLKAVLAKGDLAEGP